MSRMSTIRVLLSLAFNMNLNINQMDVSTAFLNAVLGDSLYVHSTPDLDHLISNKCNSFCLCYVSDMGMDRAS